MCELLKNNECIKSMCSPDSFLKHLDNLILDIDQRRTSVDINFANTGYLENNIS